MQDNLVRPVVEFLPLYPAESQRGARWELFSEIEEDASSNRYYLGIKEELKATSGIYIFYDSRGRALYAGKAVEQSLWKEMNSVYNRSRDEVQKIKLVRHPERNVAYRSADEVKRRILDTPLKLHDLASYVSAYEIRPAEMISMFEGLLIRAFANDLLNKRMETI